MSRATVTPHVIDRTEANRERLSTPTPYVFDRTQADHERLIHKARLLDDFAREACLRVGLGPGRRAIDVGCGPLGVLPVLADLVGPDGTVVGLNASPATLTQAQRALAALGMRSVRLVAADLTTVRPEMVPPHAPFDEDCA
jgi:ubiquinone/menaquinone biosynthesis C-methylase UbiE